MIELALTVLLSAGCAPAQATKPPVDARTGDYTTSFAERHPLSAMAEITRRLPVLKPSDYDLAQESFCVSVPASYRPETPHGLLVFINSADPGDCPESFRGLLEKHRLIYVGANKSGNERIPPARVGLALDAVHNLKKRYAVDPDRVYVSGYSGGGRVTSLLAPAFPDVFRGAMYLDGCNEVTPKLPQNLQERMKSVTGYVFLTGDKDFNRPGTRQTFEAYERAHFAHITYLQVPGMGHDIPPREWLEKGVVFLDEPLAAAAKTLYGQALGLQKRGKLGQALSAFRKVVLHAGSEPFGKEAAEQAADLEKKRDEQLQAARDLIDAGQGPEAVPLLEKLLRDYDDAAGPARELLRKARK